MADAVPLKISNQIVVNIPEVTKGDGSDHVYSFSPPPFRRPVQRFMTWDGTGVVVIHKRLDAGKFELPRATRVGDHHVVLSDAIFEVIYKGVSTKPRVTRRRVH